MAQAKTDAQLAKSGATIDALAGLQATSAAKLDRLAELYGGVCINQGLAAEEFFYNSLSAHPVLGGMKFHHVSPNVVIDSKKKQAEFDVVMFDGSSVAMIDVKYKEHPSDLKKTESTLKRFRKFYPNTKALSCKAAWQVSASHPMWPMRPKTKACLRSNARALLSRQMPRGCGRFESGCEMRADVLAGV